MRNGSVSRCTRSIEVTVCFVPLFVSEVLALPRVVFPKFRAGAMHKSLILLIAVSAILFGTCMLSLCLGMSRYGCD